MCGCACTCIISYIAPLGCMLLPPTPRPKKKGRKEGRIYKKKEERNCSLSNLFFFNKGGEREKGKEVYEPPPAVGDVRCRFISFLWREVSG